MLFMYYGNTMPYNGNMYRQVRPGFNPRPNNRPVGGGNFLLPFALGFVSSPLIFGATRPRPYYAPYPYFPYY